MGYLSDELIFGEMAARIGESAMLCQAAEECAELAKACLKKERYISGANPPRDSYEKIQDNLEEEAADVLLCIYEMIKSGIISGTRIEDIMSAKNKNTINRLRGIGVNK